MRNIAIPFVIFFFVLFSFVPSLYEIFHSRDVPQNRQFELTHEDIFQFHGHLSRIRKGIEGTVSPDVYTLMGLAGRWNRVPAGRSSDVYHMARFVLIPALFIAISALCRKKIIPFLLIVPLLWPLFDGAPHVLFYELLFVFVLCILLRGVVIRLPKNRLFLFVSVVIIALGFLHIISSQVEQKQRVYPLKDFILAIKVLEDQYPRDAVMLADESAGSYIPVYSGNSVYGGDTQEFFSGKMSQSAAQAFIRDNKITAVFFTAGLERIYPFLQPFYKNSAITLYEIK